MQVVNNIYTVETTTTSTSQVTTGLSATITPKYSSSKIFVIITGTFISPSGGRVDTSIARNGTGLLSAFSSNISSGSILQPGSLAYLDSPNSTSALTYVLRFATTSGTATAQWGGQPSNITLMEIAQ